MYIYLATASIPILNIVSQKLKLISPGNLTSCKYITNILEHFKEKHIFFLYKFLTVSLLFMFL